MGTIEAPLTRGRTLVDDDVFARLVKRIVTEHHLDDDLADRIVDQTAAFLAACASATRPLAPSMAVDIGWHTFILHTRDYAAFCEQVAGRFIHHIPNEDETESGEGAQPVLDRCAQAIRNAGYHVDPELWRVDGAVRCSQCHNGCADDPPPNPK